MGSTNKRYIITGGPGTGKTSLITELRKHGCLCYDEVSRKIIIEQQALGSNKTPWGDLPAFVDLVYRQTIKELDHPVQKNTFVDRGLPDSIAYLCAKSYPIPDYLLDFLYKTYYKTIVFLAPPWEEIYINDPQRPQSYQEAVCIHEHLVMVYQKLGFTMHVLPQTTLTKRVDFIMSII